MDVLIFGCGSIGNHLAHASRMLGWKVVMTDVDTAAMDRTVNQIYPGRYGEWDPEIEFLADPFNCKRSFDLVIIGTPPDVHIELAEHALLFKPKGVLIEKPLCGLGIMDINLLREKAQGQNTKLFVGYDHSVSLVLQEVNRLINGDNFGKPETIDVEFREEWSGIFAAHPWLRGPSDTYLGFSQRGGGAAGEHSHGLHLWLYLASMLGMGNVAEVTATLDFNHINGCNYDKLAMFQLKTDQGFVGRCVQDVVTSPARKWVRIQFSSGFIEICFTPSADYLRYKSAAQERTIELTFSKSRPDDFITELKVIRDCMHNDEMYSSCPLKIDFGWKVMQVIDAGHQSSTSKTTIQI